MGELDKRICLLKQKIRIAINESQLPMVVAENVLDAIKSEVLGQMLYIPMLADTDNKAGEENHDNETV